MTNNPALCSDLQELMNKYIFMREVKVKNQILCLKFYYKFIISINSQT